MVAYEILDIEKTGYLDHIKITVKITRWRFFSRKFKSKEIRAYVGCSSGFDDLATGELVYSTWDNTLGDLLETTAKREEWKQQGIL
ncbi:MAG: hypothetical protein COC24_013305 [Alphaproteobacteria bacterium]|nr:hypothetical protein [Alphaproteobacteria bacterium]